MSGKVKISIMALALVVGSANAVKFTGDGADNLFSTAGNWDSVPVHLSNVFEIDGGSSSESRIQVDSLWSSPYLSAIGIKQVAPSAGWAYVEVLDGATLSATTMSLGQNGTSRKGDLIVRSGGTLAGGGGSSGALNIGNATTGDGILTIEAGVAFSQARLDLQETGTLIFEFGADSVSTFTSTRTTAGNANYLDGLLQLDLNALNTAGVYTLIDGNSDNLLIAGALKTWLDSNGGTYSGTGNLDTDHFDVVNSPGVEWSLTSVDSGKDLVLNVTGFEPISEYSLFASQDAGFRGAVDDNRADTGKAAGMLLNDSTTRGLLEFDLSAAEYEITNAVLKLTQIQNLTGSWELSIYPLVYTANNYSWYEGTGTVLYVSSEDSPASAANAACYKYSRDDVSSPVQWEDSTGTPMNIIAETSVWHSAIATVSGTDSSAGNQIVFNLDVAELEKMRTNGVERIAFGIWGTTSLSGNYILATKDNGDTDYHPVMDLQMKTPSQAQTPVITEINVESISAGNRVEVTFEASAMASLWFSPDLVVPAWTNVVSGSSPLLHTNNITLGFYKVTVSE